MKRIYKKRDEDAVSPVIATILMVAITVVLAAVLYVMVIGMGGGDTNTAPVGTMTSLKATSSTNATLTFSTFKPTPAPMDIKIMLTATNGDIVELSFPNQPTGANTDMTATGLTDLVAPAETASATYTDLNYAANAVSAGDYVKIIGLAADTTYTLTVYHVPSDGLCSLTGSVTFQTPA